MFLPVDHDVSHAGGVFAVQTGVAGTATRRVSERIVCVKQPAKFDNPDEEGEEEKGSYRKLRYRGASFTLFECSILQASPPPVKGCNASLCSGQLDKSERKSGY